MACYRNHALLALRYNLRAILGFTLGSVVLSLLLGLHLGVMYEASFSVVYDHWWTNQDMSGEVLRALSDAVTPSQDALAPARVPLSDWQPGIRLQPEPTAERLTVLCRASTREAALALASQVLTVVPPAARRALEATCASCPPPAKMRAGVTRPVVMLNPVQELDPSGSHAWEAFFLALTTAVAVVLLQVQSTGAPARIPLWGTALAAALVALAGVALSERSIGLIVFCLGASAAAYRTRLTLPSGLSLVAFLLPFPVYLVVQGHAISTVATGLVCGAAALSWRTVRLPGRYRAPLLVFCVVYLVSLAGTPWPLMPRAAHAVLNLAAALALFSLTVSSLKSAEPVSELVHWMCLGGLLQGIMASLLLAASHPLPWAQMFAAPDGVVQAIQTSTGVRVCTSINDYELLAEYFALLLPFQVYLFTWGRSTSARCLHAAGALLGLHGLMATGTRGPFIALVLVGVLLLPLCRRLARPERIRLSIALVALAVEVVALAPHMVLGRRLVQSHLGTLTGGTPTGTPVGTPAGMPAGTSTGMPAGTPVEVPRWFSVVPDTRREVWAAVVPHLREAPWFGHGPYPIWLSGLPDPHSLYLSYLYSIGGLGLMAFLWFLGRLVWQGVKTLVLTPGGGAAWGLLAACVASLLVVAVDEVKIEYLRFDYSQEQVFLLFGLVAAVSRGLATVDTAAAPSAP